MRHAATATQGHRYQYGPRHVLAMQSGIVVTVREIDKNQAYPLGPEIVVKASWLVPLPMRYFGGVTPE